MQIKLLDLMKSSSKNDTEVENLYNGWLFLKTLAESNNQGIKIIKDLHMILNSNVFKNSVHTTPRLESTV